LTAALTALRSHPQPLGVAVAGLGFGQAVHLPALRDCPLTQPVALWHPRRERRAAALIAVRDIRELGLLVGHVAE
jgi:hypothetical protein